MAGQVSPELLAFRSPADVTTSVHSERKHHVVHIFKTAAYRAQMWNVFDTAFIVVFLAYVVTRSYGLWAGSEWLSELGFDILSCAACILFPRLAFFAISNNIIVIALRGMTVDFAFFMSIAAICFSGLAFTLWRLGK
jgi:hypothetical protein